MALLIARRISMKVLSDEMFVNQNVRSQPTHWIENAG